MTDLKINIVPCSDSKIDPPLDDDYVYMRKLTFQELINDHPAIVEKGWGEEEFNVFLKTGFIRSEVREEDGILLIDEESVFELIEIHDQLLASRIINVNELLLNSQKPEKD